MIAFRRRPRSYSELTFGVLKSLMAAYRLWGADSGLRLADLPELLATPRARLEPVVTYLVRQGLVVVDPAAGTVHLTEHGARDLMTRPLPRSV